MYEEAVKHIKGVTHSPTTEDSVKNANLAKLSHALIKGFDFANWKLKETTSWKRVHGAT